MIAETVISSVILQFPTLAEFKMKRKMVKQDRHMSRNETIENWEHSIIRKNSHLQP